MNRRFVKKLISKAGMTLTEVLMATLIMGLAAAVFASGLKFAADSFRNRDRINAQMLCNTISSAVQDELKFATGIEGEGSSFTYSSRNRAGSKRCVIGEDFSSGDGSGKVYIFDGGNKVRLISDDMYGNLAADLDASWDGTKFSVSIEVHKAGATEILSSKNFTVTPLNALYEDKK